MTKNDITPKQRMFIIALIANCTIKQAAAEVGISERTGLRYLTDPAVRAALNAALDVMLRDVSRHVVSSMDGALCSLEAIHQDKGAPASSRVSAARAILHTGFQLRGFPDLSERVEGLERQFKLILELSRHQY